MEAVETEAALVRSLKGLPVLGVEAILAKDPLHRPAALARSPAPLVHAATNYDAYAWFVAAFREAAERLRRGDREARSPAAANHAGTFCSAPFVELRARRTRMGDRRSGISLRDGRAGW